MSPVNLRSVGRVLERELQLFRRLWRGSAMSSIVGPLLFLGAMGFGLGGLIDEESGQVAGVDYLAFVAPGLMVAGAMFTAAAESLWPVMGGVRWTRSFHAMIATPIGPADVYTGLITWVSVRIIGQSTIYVIVAALLGAVLSPWAVLAIPATALCAASVAAPIAAFSVTRETDVSFPLIMRLGITPLFLFSGTFFPVEDLPDRVEPLVVLSPLYHGVSLARAATTGAGEVSSILTSCAFLVALTVGAWTIGMRTFSRRLIT